MENFHRDALGHRTVDPVGYKALACGHAVGLDFLMDELCPFCVDYEEAYALDAQAASDAVNAWFSGTNVLRALDDAQRSSVARRLL